MKIDILTLFPDMFDGFLSESIIKRAITSKQVEIRIHNIRDYSLDKHFATLYTSHGFLHSKYDFYVVVWSQIVVEVLLQDLLHPHHQLCNQDEGN